VVTFAEAPLLARYEAGLGLPFAFYGDPERRAYAAFGFGRATRARVWLDPRVWRRYGSLIARGRRPSAPVQDDLLQLGGDVLVDPGGRVEWVYRSAGPEDRPSVDALLAAGAHE
jgi:AhpC/TSA antioxidant enzyme